MAPPGVHNAPSRTSVEEVDIISQCAQCGRSAGPDDRYCGGCGTPLLAECTSCGLPLATDVAFCTDCGAARSSRPQAASAPTDDRRRISVLFIDLIDFTPYVERADPELVRQMQTGFFAEARRVVGQYGGVVEKYIGDAVMALFGAPVATETDAVRCVRAGLELQRVLGRFASPAAGGHRYRVGVATGEALVDVAAARNGGQAIVAGDVVNTASRLQSSAPPGGVLVCGATYAATRTAIRYAEQDPVVLRGRSTPTEVWLALAPLQATPPDRDPGLSPLVNRTHELGVLVNALHRALTDRIPQLVTVLGHAGIGKSRLVRELYRHADQRSDHPVAWRTGRCPPYGENVAYAALAEIVKAQAGILDTDNAETARERLEAALRELVSVAEAARLCDALGPLVGLQGSRLSADDAESAWRRFVVAMATHQPTVLIFEDMHLADDAMLRFVELLGASVREIPLLIVCTARPQLVERDPAWAGATGSLMITLPPLRDREIATMYGHLLEMVGHPSEPVGPLVELADGNPLYAHEYIRMLAERGSLAPPRANRMRALPMPDSVHAVIANRVDLLDPADRAVLQAASVVGMQFWPGAVSAALGRRVEAVERSLRRLEQRDLIHEELFSTMAGQPEYRFGHILVRDVCYQRLPRTERVARHQRTADWLDEMSAGRSTDLAEVVAHHRYTAHEVARILGVDAARHAGPARAALERAARRASALSVYDTAAAHAARALALCDTSTATPERLRLELLAMEIAFHAQGDGFLADGGGERLAGLARRLTQANDWACAARAWTLLGQAAWLRADRLAALSYLDRAVELFEELPDTPEKADAYAELGRLHMLNAEHDPAIAAAGAAAAMAEQLGLMEAQANARITVGMARYQAGDRNGLAELHASYDFCQAHGLLAIRRATQNLAYVVWEEGDWLSSDRILNTPATEIPGGPILATGYSREAMRAGFEGDWDALVAAAGADLNTPSGEWDLQVRGQRAWIRLLRGDDDDAVNDAEIAAVLAAGRRSGFHRLEWSALGHAALCSALRDRHDEAAALLQELASGWLTVRGIASGEWLNVAAHAAALAGPAAAAPLRTLLEQVSHTTPWVDAARLTVAGATAAHGGDPARAGMLHLAAAARYAEIPNVTDRMLALATAARVLGPDRAASPTAAPDRAAPDRAAPDRAGSDRAALDTSAPPEPWLAELANFAVLARAPRLAQIAGIELPPKPATPVHH